MWRRDTETFDPAIARELEALEAALAGDPSADLALVALVEDVRATRPAMDAGFAEQLDDQVAAGFPRAGGGPAAWFRGALEAHRARILPALGVAATVLVGITSAVVLTGGGDDGGPMSAVSAPSAKPAVGSGRDSAGAGAGGQSLDAAPLLQSTSSARAKAAPVARAAPTPTAALEDTSGARAPSFGRKIQRNADLTLTTSPDDVQDVSDRVVETTQAVGGYVQRSQVSTSDGSGEATFTLRLPSARLDDALKRLSKLAHVGSLTQGANDITSGFVTVTDRLSDARDERRAILRQMAKTTNRDQYNALRERLRFNRSRIADLKGQLDSLRRRANFATVDVTVSGNGSKRGAGGTWTPGDALHDAGRVVEILAGVALVAGAALVPAFLLGGAAVLGGRAMRRRRRESALDVA
jgi:Domain of unknown function (DUF4349)